MFVASKCGLCITAVDTVDTVDTEERQGTEKKSNNSTKVLPTEDIAIEVTPIRIRDIGVKRRNETNRSQKDASEYLASVRKQFGAGSNEYRLAALSLEQQE